MKINSNIQAQIANSVLKTNESKYSKSTEKLSSGYKLNHASDSPAGMAISNKMNAQIRSLNKARDNAKNGVNVVQTADGALTEVHEMLQRLNQLSVKAANGVMSESDREAVQEEVDQLLKEIDRVAADTEYNTQNLLGGYQAMKGYNLTENSTMKVQNYDVDFPAGKYQVTLDASKTSIQVWNEASQVYQNVTGLRSITVEDEEKVEILQKDSGKVDDEGNPIMVEEIQRTDIGGKITVVLSDGSDLVIRYKPEDRPVKADATDPSDPGAPVDPSDPGTPADPPATNRNVAEFDITGIGGMKIQVGTSAGKEIQVVIPKMGTLDMGIQDLFVRTKEDATAAIDKIAKAIDYVSKARARIGAYQNRLESTITSLDENIENLTESYSTIKDVDMAEEMVNYTTLQVLVQAGTSMLTQANEQPQQALQLLQ